MDYKKQLQDFISQGAIMGIDVSRHQGVIDFPFVLNKYDWIKFVIIKCSENTWLDDKFVANIQSFRQSTKDVPLGIYSVIHPDKDAKAQAQFAIDACKAYEFLPQFSMVDFETPYKNGYKKIADNVMVMYNMFAEAFTKDVMIYSYQPYIQPFLPYLPKTAKYAIANYSNINPKHPGIDKSQLVLKQWSGWIPYGTCEKTPCYDISHQHGSLLELRPGDKGTPTDINVDCGFIQNVVY
jgi:GH25 family lysozyme M1 (1,4-beta-N-acetylmuramidase)